MKTIKRRLLILILMLAVKNSFAQVTPATNFLFAADSVKSGAAKDILTSFFQLGLSSLLGPDKELSINSNPFAVMLKRNPALSLDKNYKKYKPLRRLNFRLGVRFDSSFGFNGFSSGLQYSLIDQTDATTSDYIFHRLRTDELNKERDVLLSALNDYLVNEVPAADKPAFASNVNKVLQDVPFNKLDAGFQKIVKQLAAEKNLGKVNDVFANRGDSSFKQIDAAKYTALKNKIKNNLLWTIGISDSTYKDKFQFSNVAIVSKLTKGIFDADPGDNNLEVNMMAAYTFSNDTMRQGRNLKREIFTVESGINWIIRDKRTDRPFCEMKFSGSYYHNFANVYASENRDSLTINGTLRIRVLEDIWIPLEIKYAPKTGNIFGFLNIRANFTGLNKLLKGPS
ncbi:MAG: hypothetical protein JNM14_04370 [Ferruginibacter sp.]|nr:hypothetical protein [Ferruginibacter sp.]